MQRNRKIRKIEEPRNQKQQPQNMRMVKSFEPMFENSANSRSVTKVKVAPHVSNQNGQKVTLGHTPQKLARVEPIWNGETVYIIGGGPSLKDFNQLATTTPVRYSDKLAESTLYTLVAVGAAGTSSLFMSRANVILLLPSTSLV